MEKSVSQCTSCTKCNSCTKSLYRIDRFSFYPYIYCIYTHTHTHTNVLFLSSLHRHASVSVYFASTFLFNNTNLLLFLSLQARQHTAIGQSCGERAGVGTTPGVSCVHVSFFLSFFLSFLPHWKFYYPTYSCVMCHGWCLHIA